MKQRLTNLYTYGLRILLPMAVFLLCCNVATANYYLYKGAVDSNLENWTRVNGNIIGEYSGAGLPSFTFDASTLVKDTYYWLGISQYYNRFLEGCGSAAWDNHLPVTETQSVSGIDLSDLNVNAKCTSDASTCTYKMIKIRRTADGIGNVTITFSRKEKGTNKCSDGQATDSYKAILSAIVNTPTVVTGSASNISSTSITLSGSITSAGASAVVASGIKVYESDGTTLVKDWSSLATSGDFSINVTGLTANTTYKYQAYATNGTGTGTGDKLTFQTAAVTYTPPVVRWAYAPTIESPSKDLIPSAYIATHGCSNGSDATVTKLRLYIRKGANPTTSSYDKIYEFTSAGFSTYTVYTKGSSPSVYVSGNDDFLRSLTEETVLHMGFVAINNNSTNNTSAMSDIATITYQTCSGGISSLDITPAGPQLLSGSTTFTASVNDDATGTINYTWKVGGSQVQSGTSATYTKDVSANFTLEVKATNGTCGEKTVSTDYVVCSGSISGQNVTVAITGATPPSIDSELPLQNTTFRATLSGSNNATEWEWLIDYVKVASSTTPSLTNDQTINLSDYEPGDYTLTVRALGCPSAVVEKEYTIKLRNKITPVTPTPSITINACEATNGNRFAASQLFDLSPDGIVSVTTTEGGDPVDVTSKFRYEKGYIYYDASSDVAFTGKSFDMTVSKTGFSDATETFTLTLQKAVPAGSIEITVPAHDNQSTEPWNPIALKAVITDGPDGAQVLWSVYPSAGYVSPTVTDSNANTYFRGPGKSTGEGNRTYTITAKIQSSTCGTSDGVTRKIDVTPDATETCE